jgi:hypothetical protein
LWSESTREEKLILSVLSMDPEADTESVSRADVSTRLVRAKLSEDIINQALERLLLHDMLKMHKGKGKDTLQPPAGRPDLPILNEKYAFSISFNLFRRWIAKKHPLGTLLP